MDIVPSEVLEPPGRDEYRHLDRPACAQVLDGYLRRLARQDALCRRVLGQLAAAFLARRGHHKLGFARLGDYARERLGLSAREVQELARVADGLERLPGVAAGFDRGELSWSHVRLLVAAATPETETAWVECARTETVRGLRAAIDRGAASVCASDEDDTVDGEPRVRFWQRCPRRVRTLWREARELASRMEGAERPAWRAAEAVAAEGLSAAEATVAAGAPDVPCEPGDVPRAGDFSPVDELVPADVAALLRDADHLTPFVLDGRLRAALGAMQRIDSQIGRLLRVMADRRLHRSFGFSSLAGYVRERVGVSPRKARALIALERRSAQTPAFADAYREGRISWLRALPI